MFSLFILHMSTAEWIHGLSNNTHIFNNPPTNPRVWNYITRIFQSITIWLGCLLYILRESNKK